TARQLVSVMVTVALLSGAVGAGIIYTAINPGQAIAAPSGAPLPTDGTMLLDSENNTIAVVERGLQGVVKIQTNTQVTQKRAASPFDFFMPNGGVMTGNGSGFIYDTQGHIVTNHHVVENATEIKVQLSTGKVVPAKLIGSDRLSDLAVIKVDLPASELKPLVLANSDAIKVGQKAIAIGSPLATGNSDLGLDRSATVTEGIVSAKDRSLPITDNNNRVEYTIEGLIQTDAAINPGNSGGPLLNSAAEVIGVNTAIVSDAQGIGFAIPSSTVQKVIPQLLSGKTVGRPKLGVEYLALNSEKEVRGDAYSGLGLPADQGALVISVVPGGAAAKAGLRGSTQDQKTGKFTVVGDIITRVDGTIIVGDNLATVIRKYNPGDTVKMTILRNGSEQTVDVVLGSQ
ncbi:MAG: S1C family serine protease, partial [Bacillota bacterium]